jgi:hypothetical protein
MSVLEARPMKTLLLVHATGLSPDQAVRGDLAANLSDLIADGSFAALVEPPDPAALAAALGAERVGVVSIPFTDMASFDAALGGARDRASRSGAALAVVSETVFVSQQYFPEVKPGAKLAAGDVRRLLAAML